MRKLNNVNLKEAVANSFLHCEKYGKHSDVLGGYLIDMANIVTKKYGITMQSHIVEDIKSEMIVDMIITVNRLEGRVDDVDNMFNYLYMSAYRKMVKIVTELRNKEAGYKELCEIIKQYGEPSCENNEYDIR